MTDRPLAPTDPLEVRGMKAGTTANDHGPFLVAATVAPADLTDSKPLRCNVPTR